MPALKSRSVGSNGSGLCFHLANFVGLGEEFEATPGGMTRTLLNVRLGTRTFELHQDPCVVLGARHAYRGSFIPTTKITVPKTKPDDEPAVLRQIHDLCWLLSLASMSRVVAYQVDFPLGKPMRQWSVAGTVGKSWPLIDARDGAQVRKFLEKSYPVFRRLRSKARTTACIDALISAEAGLLPVELRMVTVFVVLEMLKDVWARENGVRYRAGKFWKTGPRGGEAPYGFEAMLRDMCRDVGMRPALRRLVKYRNALIHSGGMRQSKTGKDAAYVSAQRLAREYLLRRLGYRGHYVVFGALAPGEIS